MVRPLKKRKPIKVPGGRSGIYRKFSEEIRKQFKSAGLLPYAVENIGEKGEKKYRVWILLGGEYKGGEVVWSEFAGKREYAKDRSLEQTALREFREETGDLFKEQEEDINEALRFDKTPKFWNEDGKSCIFLVQVPYDPELPAKFNDVLKARSEALLTAEQKDMKKRLEELKQLNKCRIAWVPSNLLVDAIDRSSKEILGATPDQDMVIRRYFLTTLHIIGFGEVLDALPKRLNAAQIKTRIQARLKLKRLRMLAENDRLRKLEFELLQQKTLELKKELGLLKEGEEEGEGKEGEGKKEKKKRKKGGDEEKEEAEPEEGKKEKKKRKKHKSEGSAEAKHEEAEAEAPAAVESEGKKKKQKKGKEHVKEEEEAAPEEVPAEPEVPEVQKDKKKKKKKKHVEEVNEVAPMEVEAEAEAEPEEKKLKKKGKEHKSEEAETGEQSGKKEKKKRKKQSSDN